MGQDLSKIHLDITVDPEIDSNTTASQSNKDDISYFFPLKILSFDSQGFINRPEHISRFQLEYTKQLQSNFLLSEDTNQVKKINEEFIEKIPKYIFEQYEKLINEQNVYLTYQQQLQTLLTNQIHEEKSSITPLSYLTIQSLISILLILIQSTQENDPMILEQILILTNQLCSQLPMKSLASTNTLLAKSLEPFINYFQNLSVSTDANLSKQTKEIILRFAIAKGSLKDLLPLFKNLIFNTTDIYNLHGLLIQMNSYLTETINKNNDEEKTDFTSLNYLKSVDVYPNLQAKTEVFTGQFLSSIILSHIDIDNQINSQSPNLTSLSYEFHPNTFKDLFDIIEQLSPSNETTNHILIICLKLFRNHLKLLFDLKTDLTKYTDENQLKTWFEFFRKLLFNTEDSLSEITKQTLQTLIYVSNLEISLLKEIFRLIHQDANENKYSMLINEILIQLNQYSLISNWIDSLSSNEKTNDFEILHLFIDLYFTREDNDQHKLQIENLLFTFQCLLFSRLTNQNERQTPIPNQPQLSALATEYLTYVITKYLNQSIQINNLFNSILIGLCLITNSEKSVLYEFRQPIFTAILPLLTEYYLKNVSEQSSEYLLCVIGKISNVLINGLPLDSLEIKYMNKLKLPLFTGGYISNKQAELFNSNLARSTKYQLVDQHENNNQDFLMSIYNNRDDGARLISKIQQYLGEKSVDEQTTEAIANIFAVYIKYYRRINLAKSELSQADEEKPSNDLLSLYKYASQIQTVFTTMKIQGRNSNELSKQIKLRTSFLLLSIKENDLIPLEINRKSVKDSHHTESNDTRQDLCQNTIQLKKLLLEKTANGSESLLKHSIENFLYEDFSKPSSTTDYDQQFQLDEFEECLARQYQRALIRLITYRFNQSFIENILNHEQILSIYLPYLRKNQFDWSYLTHIQSVDIQLKKDISTSYYGILKQILSIPSLFYLLNISYESMDFLNIHQEKLLETIFQKSISLTNDSDSLKFLSFNWFRIYVFKLCESIETEIILQNQSSDLLQQQELFIFNNLILNELKLFKEKLPIDFKEKEQYKNSLRELTPNLLKDSYQSIHFAFDRYLVLLRRSIYFYKHVRSICSTVDYLQELLDVYYNNNQSNVTHLLIIKLLRSIIPTIPNDNENRAKDLIEKFLLDILNTIGEQTCRKEILVELIDLYRIIISKTSLWRIVAMDFLIHSLKSIENKNNTDKNQTNQLLASLAILGRLIQSIHLGSIVQVKNEDDFLFGLIIDIYENEKLYIVQYLGTNESKALPIDVLKPEIAVLPPSDFYEYNETIVDLLGNFLQNDISNTNSLLLLQMQRYAISILSYLLTNKKSMELFMSKPYASILVKLSKSNIYPADLLVFNKQHLEQYFVCLDRCQITESENTDSFQLTLINAENESTNWNMSKVQANPLVVQSLSTSYYGWKPYASEDEVTYYKQGRIGNDELSIVTMPNGLCSSETFQEYGTKHKYCGRIIANDDNINVQFPTFIFDSLQFNQGKWYYCVRLPQAGLVQIGWATNGFAPGGSRGVGDDQYSWSYDGSRATLFYGDGFEGQFESLYWKADDIIGCGIEIDGQNTNIKYWLNGTFLGPAFTHDVNVPLSTTKCNLLPNGPNTTYYPAISLSINSDPPGTIEIIVSPEDMQGCPLPYGYKPLLSPEVIQTENTIVEYPYHAYLIGENSEEFFMRNSSTTILRDFINDKHMETSFTGENNDGLMVSLDNNNLSSLTISFDYQILSNDNQKSDVLLVKLDSMEISWPKTNQKQQCAMIFLFKQRQIKVYVNHRCQTYDDAFSYEHIKQFHLHLLPGISAEIRNLAIWKYSLSEEQISRLFSYGLFYIVNDYQQRKEYRRRNNTISFRKNQQQFDDELLLPFNEPFSDSLWEIKKKQIDENESKYFQSHDNEDYSTVQLYGHQTYLILKKSQEEWSTYSIRLDISIPQWPLENEKLILMTLNSKTQLYLTSDGRLVVETDYTKEECFLFINFNEYFQIFLTVNNQSLQIYVNNDLNIFLEIINNRFQIQSNSIELFKQIQNPTNDNQLLLSFKSLTYSNQSLTLDQLQSLSTFLTPTFEMIGSSLIAMGYKKHWIDSLSNQNLPIILHQQKEEFIKNDFDNVQQRYLTVLSKLNPSINSDTIKQLIDYSKFNTNEHLIDTAQRIYIYLLSSQNQTQSTEDISMNPNLNEWLDNMPSDTDDEKNLSQFFNVDTTRKKKTTESIEYSHENLSLQQLQQCRLDCEQGLITIYARTAILHILKIWLYDQSNLFPLEKLNDYSLLKLFDSENFDQISSIIRSILKNECKQYQARSLLNYLQKDLMIELIEILLKPSLLNQIDLNSILKIFNIFLELSKDNSNDLESIFPNSFINLLFNFFLLNPTYEIKLSIISLFNNLLRRNDRFRLPKHIQRLFVRLLIDLIAETTILRRRLQVVLTDSICLSSRKDENQMEEYQSKIPEDIRNLILIMNMIDIWLDRTKEKCLPDQFLEQSKDLLGEEYLLNQDDYLKSYQVFDLNTDKELIGYIDQSLLNNNNSFSDFIVKLPKETQPDRIFYKNYHLLSNIPADCIHIRARFIYLLNQLLETNLSLVDFVSVPKQSFLTDQIRRMQPYLLFSTRLNLLNKSLKNNRTSSDSELSIVKFDTVKASADTNNPENTMFYQAYQQLHSNAHKQFRRANDCLWQVQYPDMENTDADTLYRDSIKRICSDICSTRLSLFILCPNGRTNNGWNRDCWIPNVFQPDKSLPIKYQKQYRFVGQLLGMAIRTKYHLNIKFPQLLWKRLLNEDLTMEDIQAIDLQSFTIIKQLENNIEQIQSFETDQDMDSVFSRIMSDLHFTIMSSSEQIYELMPDGKNISITAKNLKEYCSLYRQYRLNEFHRQIELIQQGLHGVVPAYSLSLFTPNELEDLVCGKDRIDIELLKRNTTYGEDYSETSLVIERFWKVMTNMFTDKQRKLFLNYVSGRSTLPTRDEDFQLKFRVNRYHVDDNEDVDKIFPRSHRCYFTIDLPAYTTEEIMYEHLSYVISSGATVARDKTIDDELNREQTKFDDNFDNI